MILEAFKESRCLTGLELKSLGFNLPEQHTGSLFFHEWSGLVLVVKPGRVVTLWKLGS